MSKLSDEQKTLLAQIDAIMLMIDRYGNLDFNENFNVTVSPFKLLLGILKRCGVGYDEIIDWLARYIVYVTPILEIAVKGLLLAKLKSNIDCNLDPRIPAYLREQVSGAITNPFINNSIHESGFEIDLQSLDYYGLLYNSPMSDTSHYNYFGTKRTYSTNGIEGKFYSYKEIVKECNEKGISAENISGNFEIESVYELVRAKDFNAFLWFVLHKAFFLNGIDIDGIESLKGKSILKEISGTINEGIAIGQTFTQTNSSVMSLCTKCSPNLISSDSKELPTNSVSSKETSNLDNATSIEGNKMNITNYNFTIVPTTNQWNAVNWYVCRKKYFDFTNKIEWDYQKEFALFKLERDVNKANTFIFKIKASPNFLVPKISTPKVNYEKVEGKNKLSLSYSGDMPWNFVRLTFNEDGEKEFFGKYSVIVDKDNCDDSDVTYKVYCVKDFEGNNSNDVKLKVNKKTNDYVLEGEDKRKYLYECYPGITVYEFNYDFVMGIRLFDPTVIAARLVEELSNIKIGLNFNKKTTDHKLRISEVVKKMVETNGYSISDCFYTFSNEEYDSMLEKSELKRANLYPFQDETNKAVNLSDVDVYGTLNEYNDNATLEENIDVIKRTVNNVSATVTQESLPEDKYSMELDFIHKAIEMLVSVLVESLITPKLLFIFAINKKIMGDDGPKNWSLEYILKAFENIIMGLVNEIVDMLLQELLTYVMKKIKELLEGIAKILLLEQIEFYTRLMSQMLKACSFKLPKNPNLASTLDYVDYADIDENDKVVTNEC